MIRAALLSLALAAPAGAATVYPPAPGPWTPLHEVPLITVMGEVGGRDCYWILGDVMPKAGPNIGMCRDLPPPTTLRPRPRPCPVMPCRSEDVESIMAILVGAPVYAAPARTSASAAAYASGGSWRGGGGRWYGGGDCGCEPSTVEPQPDTTPAPIPAPPALPLLAGALALIIGGRKP